MPKPHHFKDKKQPRYFNAFKFNDQDGKAPKLGFLSEETMSYYRQVSATLEIGFDEDDPNVKREFLNNVYAALKDEGIKVSQNQTVSRILEVLFNHSEPTHLRGFFVRFCKELTIVTFDRFASHVFQALIRYLPRMFDDDEDADEHLQLKGSLNKFCQFTESHMRDVMTHTYGSHVLRSLLEMLGGVPVSDDVIRSPLSRKPNTVKKLVISRALSEEYHTWFVALKDKIIRLCNYEDHLSDNNYCPVLQTVLLILNKVSPAEYKELASTIISKTCTTETADSSNTDVEDINQRLPLLVQSDVGSYLMELLISLASESGIKDLYNDIFKGKIIYFAVHPLANYVLQKMLLFVSDKEMFIELLDEILKYIEDILAANHVGIITKLLEACKMNHTGQEKVFKALMSAFHCEDPPERQEKVVPLIASMQTYDIMFPTPDKPDKKPGVLNNVNIHGSLILQQLVCFHISKTVVSSLLQLSTAELSFLCCDKSGSHVVDAFFQSTTVKERSKDDFLKKLQGLYVNIACNRNGSRCLESIWKCSMVKRRTFIAEELLKGQERIEFDQWGHFLYNNFALFKFSQRRKEWLDIQSGNLKKQQLLQNILEGNVEKRKKNKKRKNQGHQAQSMKDASQNLPPASTATTKAANFAIEKHDSDTKQTKAKKRTAAESFQNTEETETSSSMKKKEKKKKDYASTYDVETKVEKNTFEHESDSEKSAKKRKRKKNKRKIVRGGDANSD